MTVVLASAGYPASSSKGDVISGLDDAAAVEDVEVTHAGTARSNGDVVTAGGRVLNATGIGPTAAEARRRAYDAAGLIHFEGMQMRTDIAARTWMEPQPRRDYDDRMESLMPGAKLLRRCPRSRRRSRSRSMRRWSGISGLEERQAQAPARRQASMNTASP